MFRGTPCMFITILCNRHKHKTVLKSCLLKSTKSRIHSLCQFDKLVTNCNKRVHKTVLIWGTLVIGSMKYLWACILCNLCYALRHTTAIVYCVQWIHDACIYLAEIIYLFEDDIPSMRINILGEFPSLWTQIFQTQPNTLKY